VSVQLDNLFYAVLTVFVTVVFVTALRVFGKLPVSLIGPDLNLLTYGFLWDTASKALRGAEYWPRFVPLAWNVNRPTTLFVISAVNLLALGSNMKLAHLVEGMKKGGLKDWVLRPLVTMLGVFSLFVFLLIQSSWEASP